MMEQSLSDYIYEAGKKKRELELVLEQINKKLQEKTLHELKDDEEFKGFMNEVNKIKKETSDLRERSKVFINSKPEYKKLINV